MKTLCLEFNKIEVLLKRESWKLYFVLVTEHPDDPEKMVVSSFPEPHIKMGHHQDNVLNFVPESSDGGADGMFVVERPEPKDKTLKVRVYLRHDRKELRDAGSFLSNMKEELGGDAFDIVSDILGTSQPWLVIAKKAVPMVGKVLQKVKDKGFGFVSMDERFGPEFDDGKKHIRSNNFSTGNAKIEWSWSVK